MTVTDAEPRKQQVRSAKSQEKILKATLACLADHGYAETSLNRVVEMAGLSKGALKHHFPSKEDLIVETVNYLLHRTEVAFELHKEKWAKTKSPVGAYVAFLWQKLINTKPYFALMEILNAARTDPALAERISFALQTWSDQRVRNADLFQSSKGDEDVALLTTMTICLMRGLLVQKQFSNDPKEQQTIIERWVELIAPSMTLRE